MSDPVGDKMLANPFQVQTSRLITSYALPPQTRFLCAPCSIYWRSDKNANPQRLTYAVTSDQNSKTAELIAFVEDVQKGSSADLTAKNHTKKTFKLQHNKVFSILPIAAPRSNDDSLSGFDVCVVYTSGALQCLSGDLAGKRWESTSAEVFKNDTVEGIVDYATIITLDQARKTILKSREDALGAITQASAGASSDNQPLLILATSFVNATGTRKLTFRVCALPQRTADAIGTLQRGPQVILAERLARSSLGESEARSRYWLHASSSKIFRMEAGYVSIYDLSDTLPKLVETIGTKDTRYETCLPLTQTSLLAANDANCCVFDTTYASIQAELGLKEDDLAESKKRKQADDSVSLKQSTFVSYWSEIGLAIAVRHGSLIGMQVNFNTTGRKRAKTSRSLLADAFGKGRAVENAKPREDLTEWKRKVDEWVQQNQITALEKACAFELKVPVKFADEKADAEETSHAGVNGLTNGDGDSAESNTADDGQTKQLVWDFPKDVSALITETDQRKASYVLSKMFEVVAGADGARQLGMAFYAPNILKWLALVGSLNADMVKRSLSQHQSNASFIRPGDIVRAMTELDPSLGVMHEFFNWPVHVDLEEVVEGLKAAIQSLESPPAPEQRQITSSAEGGENDNAGENDNDVVMESQAAEDDLAFALASLNNGLVIRSLVLRAIFDRLNLFPATRVVDTFRKSLSQKEIVFLITLLRIELADGGWTIRYSDEPEDEEMEDDKADGPSNRSITVISNLLNIAIDAVGTSGWLVALSGDKQLSTDEMLLILRAEASAALEGCYEANTLGTVLNDFERYSQRMQEIESKKKRKAVDPLRNPGFLRHDEFDDPALPLGFKTNRIETTKVSKGGVVRMKSKQEMGKEISMRVGKYSIDRIRV